MARLLRLSDTTDSYFLQPNVDYQGKSTKLVQQCLCFVYRYAATPEEMEWCKNDCRM